MRIKMRMFIFMLFLFTASWAFSEKNNGVKEQIDNKKTTEETGDGSFRKILIFPFENFSESGMKYLTNYIPELIRDSLGSEKNIKIIIAEEILKETKRLNLKIENYYDTGTAMKLLEDLNGYAGIMGRYIIQGKVLRIDYRGLILKENRVVKGGTYDIPIDSIFLSSLEKFSGSVESWFKIDVLREQLFDFDKDKENIFVQYYEKIGKSRIGIIIKNKWLLALIICVIFYILSLIAGLFFEKVLKRITGKTATSVDEEIVDISKKPVRWIIIFFGIKLAVFTIGAASSINKVLLNITTGVIIMLAAYLASKIAEIIIQSWGKKITERIESRIDDDLIPLFLKISKIVIISIGIIMVLSRFNVNIAPLIASLGIAGFAIGFAVKDSLSNVIGGIVLILDRSFAVGDKVSIDGDVGVIKEVGLRNTKIQTFDNEIIVYPNGDLMNKKFKNYVLPDPMIRVVVNFGVAYGSDVDMVEEVVLKAVKSISEIAEEPAPSVVFTEMGDFSLNFQAKFWVPNYVNQYNKWVEATKVVYKSLNEAGINIPFPTHTIIIEKEG